MNSSSLLEPALLRQWVETLNCHKDYQALRLQSGGFGVCASPSKARNNPDLQSYSFTCSFIVGCHWLGAGMVALWATALPQDQSCYLGNQTANRHRVLTMSQALPVYFCVKGIASLPSHSFGEGNGSLLGTPALSTWYSQHPISVNCCRLNLHNHRCSYYWLPPVCTPRKPDT